MGSTIKIGIADDHKVFRQGIASLLRNEKNIDVMFEAENGEEILKTLGDGIIPDIILCDIRMPVMDGIEATSIIKMRYPQIKIIILTMHEDEEYFYHLIRLGVSGYLLKNCSIDEMATALHKVADGKPYYSPEIMSFFTRKKTERVEKEPFNDEPINFTDREMEILTMICSGFTNEEIADAIDISVRTVDGHRAKLIKKADAKNTAHLVTLAFKNKWVLPDKLAI